MLLRHRNEHYGALYGSDSTATYKISVVAIAIRLRVYLKCAWPFVSLELHERYKKKPHLRNEEKNLLVKL